MTERIIYQAVNKDILQETIADLEDPDIIPTDKDKLRLDELRETLKKLQPLPPGEPYPFLGKYINYKSGHRR